MWLEITMAVGEKPYIPAANHPIGQAFACPAAVVSTFFSLARVLVMERRLRRALAMIHLGHLAGHGR